MKQPQNILIQRELWCKDHHIPINEVKGALEAIGKIQKREILESKPALVCNVMYTESNLHPIFIS